MDEPTIRDLTAQIAALKATVNERHDRYLATLESQRQAVDAAFAAASESTRKVEEAQQRYNVAHNDRMPRMECERQLQDMKERIGKLEATKDENAGGKVAMAGRDTLMRWLVGLLVSSAVGLLAIALGLFYYLSNK